MALLEARGLGLELPSRQGSTRRVRILREIELVVEPGECVGIVGESGSGKTSLLRTLGRLHEPTEGVLSFEGRDITHLDESALRSCRARMQFIFQDSLSSLNPRHRIGRILGQPRIAHAVPHVPNAEAEDATDLLARVGLPADVMQRYPHELSGGQRQRVGIARALALCTRVIFADEILSGQDAKTKVQICRVLAALRPSTALILVSHDLASIGALCDRIIVMRDGQIVESGPTEEVMRAPRNVHTQDLLRAAPSLRFDPRWLDT